MATGGRGNDPGVTPTTESGILKISRSLASTGSAEVRQADVARELLAAPAVHLARTFAAGNFSPNEEEADA